MGAGHDHGHGSGATGSARTRLVIAFAITAGIVLSQAVGSVVTGSLALLTDTAHAVVDASGLLVALIAATMLLRPASSTRTWGFARIEVLAALAQATLLIVVGTYTAIEGISRLGRPPEVPSGQLLVFGVVGLLANVIAILVLAGGKDSSLNMRAAFLEVLNDALGSLGVITAAIVIQVTGFQQADALAGLFIAALIVPRAFRIMAETLRILMEYTPKGVDLDQVREHILALEHVQEVHDLHASAIGSNLPIISAHVVVGEECFESSHALEILEEVQLCVSTHFPVAFEHATIQLESPSVRHREGGRSLHS
ncbi:MULTISPECIES: cation diffusion facilitator family transporter [Brachybacterium]|uniref:Cation diffusion facilitator family transporter n=1 Tax=Brachybacterium rhamnosum TaxID=173361 RepID=A0ABW4PYI8_9MICO|nr:cation diffusion facilitator family transporter [Brachybacterium squillarum]MCW1804482.1 cation diffusion facilitator family transporter [Brachybacterium squillarum]